MFADLTIQDYIDAPNDAKVVIEKWMRNQYITKEEYDLIRHYIPWKFRQSLKETARELARIGNGQINGKTMELNQPVQKTESRKPIWSS